MVINFVAVNCSQMITSWGACTTHRHSSSNYHLAELTLLPTECFCVTSPHATHCCKQDKINKPEWPHVTLSQSRPMLSLKISYSWISVLTSNCTIEMSPSSHGTVKRHIEMSRMLWDCLIVFELASWDCCTTSSEIVPQLCVRQMTWLFVIF